MTVEQALAPLPRRTLLVATFGAAIVAGLIVFGAIIPAEYGRDPLGLGKLSGLSRLWSPEDNIVDTATSYGPRAREYSRTFRSDVVEIPLGMVGGGVGPYSIEYKVQMAKDATLIYQWEVLGPQASEPVKYDFHGHTTPMDPKVKMTVANYKQASASRTQGALTAPFDGIQGWYFENPSTVPIVIRLKISGFYDLVPAGKPGNEAGIVANVPAAKAFAQGHPE